MAQAAIIRTSPAFIFEGGLDRFQGRLGLVFQQEQPADPPVANALVSVRERFDESGAMLRVPGQGEIRQIEVALQRVELRVADHLRRS